MGCHMAGEPIAARPPSSLYRFRKLFLRHKLLISGLGLFFLSLVTLLGFTGVLLRREQQLRQQSDLLAADSLANVYVQDGKLELAESMFLRALEIRRKQAPNYLPTPQSLENLLWALLHQRKFDTAEELLDRFLSHQDVSRNEYIDLLELRAEILARCGRWTKAQADAEKLHDLLPERFGFYHTLAPLMVANKDLEGYQRCRVAS